MEDLRGIGVLEDWLEDVGNASEDTFLDLADYMPQAAAEALLSYAAHGILRLPEASRTQENQKMACGKRHFEALKVGFGVVTRLAEVAM